LETLLRIRSLAAYIIGTLESRFRKRQHVYASMTRFIPDGLLNLFDKRAWPVIAAGSAGVRGPSQVVRVDVGARMRGMWR